VLAAAIADYVDNFYNVERRHTYLDNIGPSEFELLWASTYSISTARNGGVRSPGSTRQGQASVFVLLSGRFPIQLTGARTAGLPWSVSSGWQFVGPRMS
jgi:hypothetical protein